MKSKYELTIILKPEFKEEIKDKLVEKIEKTVKALDGVVSKSQDMGRKQLAYKIENVSEGVYMSLTLEMPRVKVVELNKKLAVDKDLLRYLLVKEETTSVKKRGTMK